MKIERIDDKTVKCFLSNEELEEYDIDYKDFVTRSDKAKRSSTGDHRAGRGRGGLQAAEVCI